MAMSEIPASDLPSERDVDTKALLIMRTGGTWLAVDAELAERVAEKGDVTALPRAPAHIPGLTLIKARAVPVLDLAVFLELAAAEGDNIETPRLVVVRSRGLRAAVPCARVDIARNVPAADIQPADESPLEALPKYAIGTVPWKDELAIVLDLPAVLEAARVRRG